MIRWLRAALLVAVVLVPAAASAWDRARLSMPVVINDHLVPYPVFAIFVMPGAAISVALADPQAGATVTYRRRTTDVHDAGLIAPAELGVEPLEIRNSASGEICRINVFTLVPATTIDGAGRLNDYRIGDYPSEPLRDLEIYLPPEGFVEVTRDNVDTELSPNFRLGQFVSKQEADFPKYVVLRSELMLKLENILASLNYAGYRTSGLVIMSGYRTPFYNQAIGNVPYSRHVWGGAADVYIDQYPADGRMDDLNRDGRVDRADATWLANFINDLSQRGAFGPRIGGLGVYGSTSAHGPFVHVDVRGMRARW